jgi:hypothetical protein
MEPWAAFGFALVLAADPLSRWRGFYYVLAAAVAVLALLFLFTARLPDALKTLWVLFGTLLYVSAGSAYWAGIVPLPLLLGYVGLAACIGLGAAHLYLKHVDLASATFVDIAWVFLLGVGAICFFFTSFPRAVQAGAATAAVLFSVALWRLPRWLARRRAPVRERNVSSASSSSLFDDEPDHPTSLSARAAERWRATDATEQEVTKLLALPAFRRFLVKHGEAVQFKVPT